jgi:alpha-tubulin suppressor-like RCC1 family protein
MIAHALLFIIIVPVAVVSFNAGTAWRQESAFAALTKAGGVVTWGRAAAGGEIPSDKLEKLASGVIMISSTFRSFAALKDDGSVIIWGDELYGGTTDPKTQAELYGIVKIVSFHCGFQALRNDTKVVVWGFDPEGGVLDKDTTASVTGVKDIFSTYGAFAMLKYDGTVVVRGDKNLGAYVPWYTERDLVNVRTLYSSFGAFAALKNDGTVVAFGGGYWDDNTEPEGQGTNARKETFGSVIPEGTKAKLQNVKSVSASITLFCALTHDGKAIPWGDPEYVELGNWNEDKTVWTPKKKKNALDKWYFPAAINSLMNVVGLYSTDWAMCAVHNDGTVTIWGRAKGGGSFEGSEWEGNESEVADVREVFSSASTFVALTNTGNLIVWGENLIPAEAVMMQQRAYLNSIVFVVCNIYAAIALRSDGMAVVWGKYQNEESIPWTPSIAVALSWTNVRAQYMTAGAFAFVKSDGSVIAAPDSMPGCTGENCNYGGHLPEATKAQLDTVGVDAIFGDGKYQSDSTMLSLFPCPIGTYGEGFPDCTECPTPAADLNDFSPGIRSNVGNCIVCPEPKFSIDGLNCVETCVDGYTYYGHTYYGISRPGCRKCGSNEYYSDKTNTCELCGKGKYTNGTGCETCPRGTYTADNGTEACNPCELGFTTKVESPRVSIDECYKICQAGEFSEPNSKYADACYACDKGKYSAALAWKCVDCPAGKFADLVGMTECEGCVPGKYANSTAQLSCDSCPVDFITSGYGHSICVACPEGKGTYNKIGQSVCSNRGLYMDCGAGHRKEDGTRKCLQCGVGTYSLKGDSTTCSLCPSGKYGDKEGSSQCVPCTKGKFSSVEGAESEDSCNQCPKGKYNSFEGMKQCEECPPGSECDEVALEVYTQCKIGYNAPRKGSVECSFCPPGRYQNSSGEAFCQLCGIGKYGASLGSVSVAGCNLCPLGTFGNSEGLSVCTACSRMSYTTSPGSTQCEECTELNTIGNADHTGCVIDTSAVGPSLIETMYTKGVALYGAFVITACFAGIVALMQFKKEKMVEIRVIATSAEEIVKVELPAIISRPHVALKVLLPGFSFASEMFLIAGVMSEAKATGTFMILFRLLHMAVGATFAGIVIGPKPIGKLLENHGVVKNASTMHTLIAARFCLDNIPIVGGVVLISLADCTLLQFMPWKPSAVFTESKGFPNMTVLRWCLGTKIVQAFVSIICQISYLSTSAGLKDATTTAQAKALFGLNITLSMVGLFMSIVMMCLKDGLLSRMERSLQVLQGKDGTTNGDGNGADHDRVHQGGDGNQRFSNNPINIIDLYPDAEEGMTANPMFATNTEMAEIMISSSSSSSSSSSKDDKSNVVGGNGCVEHVHTLEVEAENTDAAQGARHGPISIIPIRKASVLEQSKVVPVVSAPTADPVISDARALQSLDGRTKTEPAAAQDPML